MTDQPLNYRRGTCAGPIDPGPAGAGRDRGCPGHDHRLGVVCAGRHDGGHAGHAGGGGRVRRRSGRHLVRGPDADHRQLLPPAQPVERQLRRFLRVGRPRDQPLPGLHGRLADARGLLDRNDFRGGSPLPAVLAIFGASATSTWPNIFISTAVTIVMLIVAVVGIRITARTQVGLAVVEYTVLLGVSIWGLVYVLGHHHGVYPITKGWLSLSGIDGHGSLAAGLLIAVFMFSGWDATVYVNEEVKHRRVNPGRAALWAVALLVIMYVLPQVGLQGVVSPAKLQANSSSGAGLRHPDPGRRRVGQGDGLRAGSFCDRVYQHRHRDHRPDRLRDGEPPGPAAGPGPGQPPLLHPRDRQHHHRRDPHRRHLGVPAVHRGGERLHHW